MKSKFFLLFAVMTLLLLSACGTIEIEQKLYKDGTFDLTMRVTSDDEMFLSLFEEGAGDLEGATVREIEGGVEYVYEGIELSDDDFKNSFSSVWGIEKEYKFPNQYVTLKFNDDVEETSDDDMFGFAPKLYYTIDPFGKITDTNGLYNEDQTKVKFDLTKNKEYYVTFKYFCLVPAWCGAESIPEREADEGGFDLGMPEDESSELDLFGDSLFADSDEEPIVYGPVTNLQAYCVGPDNWDADADNDGILINVKPLDKDDNIVPLEGTVKVSMNMLYSDDWGMEFFEMDEVYSESFTLIGDDRLNSFDGWWTGYSLDLEWDAVQEYDSGADNYGNLYVEFTDLEGNTFSAKEEHSFLGSCRLRE